MSFLLMNLFSAPAQAAPLAGGPAAKDAAATPQGTAGGAAFSAMLTSAKERLSAAKAVGTTALTAAQPIDVATMQAIKQPADILAALKDMAPSDQQLTDLRAALRDVLDSENFAGNEQTEQAFQELHDQLDAELGDAGSPTDVVDMDAVVMQLPAVNAASQQPRGELIARIAQFIQATLSGQGNTGSHAKPEQHAQIAQHASNRTDPLLEVVQASMFPAETISAPQAQGATEQTQTVAYAAANNAAMVIPAAMTVVEDEAADDLPQWVRDIAPAPKAAATDAGDIYRDMPLPEVNLPGNEDAAVAPADQADAVLQEMTPVSEGKAVTHNVAAAVAAAVQQVPVAQADASKAAPVVSTQAAATHIPVMQAAARETAPLQAEADAVDDPKAPTTSTAAKAAGAESAKASQFVAALENASKPQPQAREQQLGALPESNNDVTLEAVRTDAAPSNAAPTHHDKLTATHAQRAADSSLYQHRTQVVEQVHVAIARASKADMDRITIQLDPADLGRVDVTMDVRRDGTTQLVVVAERRETLDMLQRDARSLERALQEAGVKADAGSMEFNLRQQHGQSATFGGQQGFNQNPNQAQQAALNGEVASANGTEQTVLEPEIISSATYTVNGGLNVIV